ncbi:MAG: hypothetical protein M0022_04490, partial [Desulfobacteraceae bacterium]|nr:hypothetical protein [Desulfobacteraceae bacterium]
EIVVGTVAQLVIGALIGTTLGSGEPWIMFLSGTGAIVLTFLAGAELDPAVFKLNQTQYSLLIATVIGSAVIPTLIANAFFLPKYLLPKKERPAEISVHSASIDDIE